MPTQHRLPLSARLHPQAPASGLPSSCPLARRADEYRPALPPGGRHYRLPAGTSVQLDLGSGSVVHVGQGRLELIGPPCWMAETIYWPAQLLGPDSLMVVRADGCYILRAHADLDLTLHRRQRGSLPRWFARILSRGWEWLKRHRAP